MFESKNWMIPRERELGACLVVYRNRFCVPAHCHLSLRYSADENATVFLDGEYLSRGPERGCDTCWYFDELELDLTPGAHTLAFRVPFFDYDLRPHGQMSVRHGLTVQEISLISGAWEYRILNVALLAPQPDWGVYPKVSVPENFDSTVSYGGGEDSGWQPVAVEFAPRTLHKPELPPMRRAPCQNYEQNGEWITFREYGCYFADYLFDGVGSVMVRYFESAEQAARPENEPGVYEDTFHLSGSPLRWHDLWYRAGKLVRFHCTGSARVKAVHFYQTGYPYRFDRLVMPEAGRTQQLMKKALHSLECCSFESFMDCPYFEQIQYVGDARIEALLAYAVTSDRRLARKALRMFAAGIKPDGALPSRYPAKDTADLYCTAPVPENLALIPGYSFFFIQMLHDYAVLREDDALVAGLLPAARKVAAWGKRYLVKNILWNMPGWNFLDWRTNWPHGTPPLAAGEAGCTLNFIYIRALLDLADMEKFSGNEQAAALWLEQAQAQLAAVKNCYYDREKGGYAENSSHSYFSEHAQVMAILATGENVSRDLLAAGTLDECGIYFSFYYLAAMRFCGENELFERRMERYLALAETPELDTLPEEFAAWRSCCHAWSAHGLYFFSPRCNDLMAKLVEP